MHALPASHAASAARYFAMFASGPHGSPVSKSAAALSRMSAAASTDVWAREIGNCTPWFAPIRLQHARDEHLPAVDDVPIALAYRRRLELRRVRPGVRLGDAERLKAQVAGRDLRQVLLLLLVRAMPQHGAHDVHLRVTGRGVTAVLVDRLEDQASLGDAEPGAAEFLWNERRHVAGARQLGDERFRVLTLDVEIAPVLAGIALADVGDA